MFNAMLLKRVPDNWAVVAYPSLKPLGSWFIDFAKRIEFFKEWVSKGKCYSYWVSAMFFP